MSQVLFWETLRSDSAIVTTIKNGNRLRRRAINESSRCSREFSCRVVAGPLVRSFADTATSADFMVQDGFVGIFGGYASSTDFQVVNGGAPIVNGECHELGFQFEYRAGELRRFCAGIADVAVVRRSER